MRSRLTSRLEGAMARAPLQKLPVTKSIAQSMRDVIDDLEFTIKSSNRTIAESRKAIAAANKILARRVPDKSRP